MGPFQQPAQEVGGLGGGSGPPPGSSNVTTTGLTATYLPVANGATSIVNSHVTDTGALIVSTLPAFIQKDTSPTPLNNVAVALDLFHTSSGGGLAGNGVRLNLDGADSTGLLSVAGAIDGVFTTATAGSEVSEQRFYVRTAAGGATPVLALTVSGAAITPSVPINITVNDAATVTTTDIETLTHNTTGAAGVGFGAGLLFNLENAAGGAAVNGGRISSVWTNATAAAEASKFTFATRVAGAALATAVSIGAGLFVGAATDPGANNFAVSGTALVTGVLTTTATAVSNGGMTVATGQQVSGAAELNLNAATGSLINGRINSVTQASIGLGAMILGAGDASATTTSFAVRGAARTGADAAPSILTFQSFNGTGTGGGGNTAQPLIVFQTGLIHGSDSVAMTQTTRAQFGAGLLVGSAAYVSALDPGLGGITIANNVALSGIVSAGTSISPLIMLNSSNAVIVGSLNRGTSINSLNIMSFSSTGTPRFQFAGTSGVVVCEFLSAVGLFGSGDGSATVGDFGFRGTNVVAGTAATRGGSVTQTTGLGTGSAVSLGHIFKVADVTTGTLQQTATVKATILASGLLLGASCTLQLEFTDTGTTANPTANTASGRSKVAIGASTSTVTNSLCTTASKVIATNESADATATTILRVVPGAGSFVVTYVANAAALTTFSWIVIN